MPLWLFLSVPLEGLRIVSNLKFKISDVARVTCLNWKGNPKSAIRNRQSEIGNPQSEIRPNLLSCHNVGRSPLVQRCGDLRAPCAFLLRHERRWSWRLPRAYREAGLPQGAGRHGSLAFAFLPVSAERRRL